MDVIIEKLDHFGRGICHIDQKICFVPYTLPGDYCDIRIIQEKKSFLEGCLQKIINESPYRIHSSCPHFDQCGGCQFQNMMFSYENQYKEEKVKEIMERFGEISPSIVRPILFSNSSLYRNKIVLHGKDGVLGFYSSKSHDIVPIHKCHLVLPKIQEIISFLHSYPHDISEVTIKCSNDQKYVMVSLNGTFSEIYLLKDKVDVLIYNGKCLSRKSSILTSIGDVSFYQEPSSFFQVHSQFTKILYDEVSRFAQRKKPSTILDLYCGCGTIGIYVSSSNTSLIGVDSNPSNISQAIRNAELHSLSSYHYYCDKVENRIDEFSNIDFVIIDPPRAGLDSKTRDVLKVILPSSIAYVSCDPVSLARDLKDLSSYYQIESIQPFNLFPRTYHVECVALLSLKNS